MFSALSVNARRLMTGALLTAGLCALGTTRAAADEAPPGAWIKRWIAEPPMAGNWFGARDVLNDWGINPRVRYATDLQASVAGGQRRGQAYSRRSEAPTPSMISGATN